MIVAGAASWSGSASADPPAPSPSAPKTTIDHDGTYAVGTDIVPGTYTSAGPVGNGTCYWKRVAGSDIVDNAISKKPQVVVVDPADTTFKTDGCQPWQLTPDAVAPAAVPPVIAGAQLGGYLNTLNNGARQFGQPPLPNS